MENYWKIPTNTSCQTYFSTTNFTLIGFALYYAISKCLKHQASDSLSGVGGRGIDEFLTFTANEYYSRAPQIVILYDESWDITELLIKLETHTRKSFVTYFLPLDKKLGERIKSKPADHIAHRILPKAAAFIVFVKNENGFANILRLTSKYPWWNRRARMTILVKEKSLEPTKGILNLMEKEKIFNGIVVTEVTTREGSTTPSDFDTSSLIDKPTELGDDKEQVDSHSAALQVAALDPYPAPGDPKQFFVARWGNSKFTFRLRPIFQDKIDNLRGHKLRAIVFEYPPLVMWEQIRPRRYGYTGLEVKIFNEFSKYINFTYDIYELKGTERYGQDIGNGEWSGLIGEVAGGKADIGFANVFLLDNREKAVDVSTPYDQDRGCFAVPRPEALQHWLGLVLPFSWKVWACIISMAMVAGPMFSGITRPLKLDKSLSVGRGIFYALGAMVSAQKSPKANSSALRSFIIAWLIFCWLAAILYRVALIVSLTIGPNDYRIDTLKQLVASGLRWGGYNEFLKTYTNSTSRTDKTLFKRFQPQEDMRRALDRVANKADFAIMDSSKFLHYSAKGIYYNGYSSLIHITKECPTNYNVGFVFPVGSPYLERINQLILLMQNAGLIKYWLEDIQYRALLKNPNKKRKGTRTRGLTIGHLKLCFVMVAFGCFSGFVSCVVENFIEWRKHRKLALLNPKKKLRRSRAVRRRDHDMRKDSRCSIASAMSIASTTASTCYSTTAPSVIITDTETEG